MARKNLTSALLTDQNMMRTSFEATLYFATKLKDALMKLKKVKNEPSSIPCLRTKVFILMYQGKVTKHERY